jgi:hypothetical protein
MGEGADALDAELEAMKGALHRSMALFDIEDPEGEEGRIAGEQWWEFIECYKQPMGDLGTYVMATIRVAVPETSGARRTLAKQFNVKTDRFVTAAEFLQFVNDSPPIPGALLPCHTKADDACNVEEELDDQRYRHSVRLMGSDGKTPRNEHAASALDAMKTGYPWPKGAPQNIKDCSVERDSNDLINSVGACITNAVRRNKGGSSHITLQDAGSTCGFLSCIVTWILLGIGCTQDGENERYSTNDPEVFRSLFVGIGSEDPTVVLQTNPASKLANTASRRLHLLARGESEQNEVQAQVTVAGKRARLVRLLLSALKKNGLPDWVTALKWVHVASDAPFVWEFAERKAGVWSVSVSFHIMIAANTGSGTLHNPTYIGGQWKKKAGAKKQRKK